MNFAFFKPSLLALALAAVAGGAFAKECTSDAGNHANTQAAAPITYPVLGDIVYVDPLANLARMQAAMEREFGAMNAMNALWMPETMAQPLTFTMPVQASTLQRTKDGYQIQVRVPGFNPDDVHVRLDGQLLTIYAQESNKGTRKVGNVPEESMSSRSFVQTLSLPGPVNATGFKQSVQNGILTITIPSERGTAGQT